MRFPFGRKRAALPALNVNPFAEKAPPETGDAVATPAAAPIFQDWGANDAVKNRRFQQRKAADRYNFEND
jgi:hypothetical protein